MTLKKFMASLQHNIDRLNYSHQEKIKVIEKFSKIN
jgi:hypothetical protein